MMFEAIEPRRLMSAVTAVQVGSTLFVGGTDGADTIYVNKSFPEDNARVVSIGADGGTTAFGDDTDGDGYGEGFAGVARVVLLAGGGDDVLDVTVDGADAAVLGGDGNDQIGVFASLYLTDVAPSEVFVDGGAGDDSIFADVFNNSVLWVVGGNGSDNGGVRAVDGGRIYIDAGNDDDGVGGAPWDLTAIGSTSLVLFNGGNGDDWATANAFDGGVVTADGGNGSDHLGVGTVESNGVVNLNGGNGTDTFEIININPTGSVTVNGGNGTDTLTAYFVDGGLVVRRL
jgi:hypothetical protein